MQSVKIGLLPFYLELYDRMLPDCRRPLEKYCHNVAEALRHKGLNVAAAPVCRVAAEFRRAVKDFEAAGVDALVTLHLAYSPSLESAAVLAATSLPVIVLDTTPDYDFGPSQTTAAIMRNHGIHGVQDMCNLLLRRGKRFAIEAGHWRKSGVLDRVVARVRAGAIAGSLRRARVGRIGPSFKGMGDFCVPEKELRRLPGITVVNARQEVLQRLARGVSRAAVNREIAAHGKLFEIAPAAAAAHRRSVLSGLTVRRWLEQENLSAFSVNFLAVGRGRDLAVMPFLEAGLAMGRGIGYAGEGDVLTAALVGALLRVYPDTTFTEMFCPDWKGNRVFLSHMGEWNVRLAARRPRLEEYDFTFGRAANPVRPVGCFRSGSAVFINLAPLGSGRFRLILAPGRMAAPRGRDALAGTVHGWFQPKPPLPEFLTVYSRAGGTHHAALVYGASMAVLEGFGAEMGWEVLVI